MSHICHCYCYKTTRVSKFFLEVYSSYYKRLRTLRPLKLGLCIGRTSSFVQLLLTLALSMCFLSFIHQLWFVKILFLIGFLHRIPWNGKQDVLIDRWVLIYFATFINHRTLTSSVFVFSDRFDGRALLDFIRDSGSRPFRAQEKTEEEEELEEFVNFERYRDLIKHRRRGCRYFLIFCYVLWLINIIYSPFSNILVVI